VADGLLQIVGTPIGNLEDITLRALEALKSADVVLAEDTRHSKILLDRFGISKPMLSVHEHNEAARIGHLLDEIRAGKRLALVSDAGMPSVSDPGFQLVRAAREAGLPVEVVPGPSAVLTALIASGLPTDAFTFLGFPPRKPAERARWSASALARAETVIFFESPHRLVDTLEALAAVDSGRQAAVCREMTKKFEEIKRGELTALAENFAGREEIKGELTVVLAPGTVLAVQAAVDVPREIERLRAEGKGDAEIAKAIAKATGRPRREIYTMLLERKTR
jgi:16S rRNA (cytidine1402-2'-O)-methyltransferase